MCLRPKLETSAGMSSKKYCTVVSSTRAASKRREADIRLVPRSFFWICWNVTPRSRPISCCERPIIVRRSRRRLPTWMSIGFGPGEARPRRPRRRGEDGLGFSAICGSGS
jgi:hypothetical protein